MNISELINQLIELKDKHGDVQVRTGRLEPAEIDSDDVVYYKHVRSIFDLSDIGPMVIIK